MVKHRPRGRPPRDYSDDPDLPVAELALALQEAWTLSERQAIDLALAAIQGERAKPSKVPRGGKKVSGIVLGYTLPLQKSFSGRNRDIRRKLRSGKLRPDPNVVHAMRGVLHLVGTAKLLVVSV